LIFTYPPTLIWLFSKYHLPVPPLLVLSLLPLSCHHTAAYGDPLQQNEKVVKLNIAMDHFKYNEKASLYFAAYMDSDIISE